MELICPLHKTCPFQMRMDAVFPQFPPRCNTVWCKHYAVQVHGDEEEPGSPPMWTEEPRGFRNVGNCCYANAIVRALYSLEVFSSDLEVALAAADERPLLPPLDLFIQLMRQCDAEDGGKLMDDLHGYFIDNLHLVNQRFGSDLQQDASEFLVALLQYFEEALPKAVEPIMLKHFEGIVRQEVVCKLCGNASVSLQNMRVWNMPLDSTCHAIGDCMAHFLADEEITNRECMYCSDRKAVMKKTVAMWPRVMIVCFQRFSNGEKSDAPISFPEVWRPAGNEWDANPEYLLQAVVTHLGATMNSGHYVCECRCSDGVVRLFNDQSVESHFWNKYSAGAYLLFYTKQ